MPDGSQEARVRKESIEKSTARTVAPICAMSMVNRPSPQPISKTLQPWGFNSARCWGISNRSLNLDRQPEAGGAKPLGGREECWESRMAISYWSSDVNGSLIKLAIPSSMRYSAAPQQGSMDRRHDCTAEGPRSDEEIPRKLPQLAEHLIHA